MTEQGDKETDEQYQHLVCSGNQENQMTAEIIELDPKAPTPAETPSIEECEAAGRGPMQVSGAFHEGGLSDTPEERARFEAYMRGHCWSFGNYFEDIKAYDTTMVRMLYGVWRDRGALDARYLAAVREKVLAISDKIKPAFAMCYDEKNYAKLELSYTLREIFEEATRVAR